MNERPVSHTHRPVLEELRELRDIARREHGPRARSTRLIEERLTSEERAAESLRSDGTPSGRRKIR